MNTDFIREFVCRDKKAFYAEFEQFLNSISLLYPNFLDKWFSDAAKRDEIENHTMKTVLENLEDYVQRYKNKAAYWDELQLFAEMVDRLNIDDADVDKL